MGLALASSSPHALAQSPGDAYVAVTDLTVDGDAPPSQYRSMLETGLRPTLEPVLVCYRERAGRVTGLNGDLRLRLWVSARQVIRVTPETTLSDPELQTCAIAGVRTFVLPPQAPEGGATVRLTLRFTRAALPASSSTLLSASGPIIAPPPPAPPPVTSVAIAPTLAPVAPPSPLVVAFQSVTSTRTMDELTAAIRADALSSCVTVPGELRLRITITRTGVMRASSAGGTVRDRRTVTCVRNAIRALPPLAASSSTATARATVTFAE